MNEKKIVNKDAMLQMKAEGHTYNYIALKSGVSRQRIQQILKPPIEIRRYVIKKYDGKCFKCNVYVGQSGHIHHKSHSDISHYNDIENLVLLCRACHRSGHSLIKITDSKVEKIPKPILGIEKRIDQYITDKITNRELIRKVLCSEDIQKETRLKKYRMLVDNGIPANIASRACQWGKNRILKEFGISL